MKSVLRSIKLCANSGVSLIEVLITVVILSIGLLGLAGMHFQGLKNNQSAYFRSQATILAYTALDSMRANKANALEGGYNIEIGTTATEVGTTTKVDLANWKRALNSTLPSGDGSIDCNKDTSICDVAVQWDDRLGQGGASNQLFSVTTEL